VSVVVPVYNGAPFLEESLGSAVSQSHAPQEIIVVDDASTDGSAEVVVAVAARSPIPVRLIRLPRNSGGPARPINVGVAAAQCGLIAVLDQDDVVTPGWLGSLAAALHADPEASFACCNCGRLGAPLEPAALGLAARAVRRLLAKDHAGRPWVTLGGGEAARLLLAFGNYAAGFPGFLFRRADWSKKGGLDEGLRVSSDYDLLCWLALRGPALFVRRRLYFRRFHGRNLSLSGVLPWVELVRVASRYLPAASPPPEDRAFWRRFRAHALRMLVGLGWANRHGDALRLLARATLAWGLDAEAFSVLPRLLYTGMDRNVWHRATQPDRAAGAALYAELLHLFDLCGAIHSAPARRSPLR
jgi:glycosyltransferase involved in cell wall biosynthesis